MGAGSIGRRRAGVVGGGLGSPVAAVRERAVQSLAAFPGGEATAQLRQALLHDDLVVRGHAALALGARGVVDAAPTLIDMVVEEGTTPMRPTR